MYYLAKKILILSGNGWLCIHFIGMMGVYYFVMNLMMTQKFYQTTMDCAIPLYLIGTAQIEAQLQTLTKPLRQALLSQQFLGNPGDFAMLLDANGHLSAIYLGCDEAKKDEALTKAIAKLPEGSYDAVSPLSFEAEIAWALAQYQFSEYKPSKMGVRCLVVSEERHQALIHETSAIFLTRDLINRPAQDLDPEALALVVSDMAKAHGADFKQWVGDALLTEGFPAIHAVGRAAQTAPRLLSLTWGNTNNPKVTLIGKGVCFDSGGLDLKPSGAMRLMKKDMGGAAQVIGLAQWMMHAKLPIYLNVLIPAVENAIGAGAFRPSDVLTMRNGLTVEIENTDAEGRLVLADALVKASEEKPDIIIDFATLTGAARVALGTEISMMFTPDDALAKTLSEFGVAHNDPLWRMPLFARYASLLDSTVADLMNSSPSPYAGAITAALFMQRFVDANIPWVHFDLMAWNLKNANPAKPEGGEAMAIRAVGHYLLSRFQKI